MGSCSLSSHRPKVKTWALPETLVQEESRMPSLVEGGCSGTIHPTLKSMAVASFAVVKTLEAVVADIGSHAACGAKTQSGLKARRFKTWMAWELLWLGAHAVAQLNLQLAFLV